MKLPSITLPLSVFFLISSAVMSQLSGQTSQNVRPLTAAAGENWVIRWNRSDDFNAREVDWRKWQKSPEQFSGWRWDNERNVTAQDGLLKITLRNDFGDERKEREGQGGQSLHLWDAEVVCEGNQWLLRGPNQGAPMFPGASPAFWLYSTIDDTITQAGEARYSEIDIVEMTQRQSQKEGNERITDHNLHAILSNGKPGCRDASGIGQTMNVSARLKQTNTARRSTRGRIFTPTDVGSQPT